MADAACFHCGLPVDAPGRWRVPVLGGAREFCCAGCLAVAHAIVAGGYERYYETREATSGRRAALPSDLPPLAVYDDPAALREFASPAGGAEAALEATLLLENIRCSACLWLVEQTLRRAPGVLRADVNYTTRRALVAWDPARARVSGIIAALRALGYDASPWDPRRAADQERARRRVDLWRLFVAGFGAMQVMMYAFPAYLDAGEGTLSREGEALMRWASLLLSVPVLAFSCGPFFAGAWRELRRLRPGMDTPLALGIGAGFGASAWATVTGHGEVYFDSIAMLVFLLLAARQLEAAVRRRAARGIDRLAGWAPDFAQRLDEGAAVRVPAHQLVPGDRVLVRAGERVPADGVVESGRSGVDASLLNGESRPLACGAGDRVLAGTTNLTQPLVVRVERAGGETRAAAIARLVERGSASRPVSVAAADRIAFWLTWLVLAAAAGAGLYWQSLWVAVTVLVVTCPCALALAAPVVVAAAGGRLARGGVAMTHGGALETLARATDVVLDKTGTLTEGRLRIASMHTLGASRLQACLALARGLEAASRHPLARAFDGEGPAAVVEQATEHPGQGVEGRWAGGRLRIGTLAFCRALAGARAWAPALSSGTPVYLADERGFLAVFTLEDSLRADSADAVRALQRAGLRVHLVSGDQRSVVDDVANALGIEARSGEVSPEGKFDYVECLQRGGRVVAMIGDGLNDAPVLARADVSLAMGGGADSAQRQADFVLLGDSLSAAAGAFGLARRAMRVIRENFAWALAYNAIALPLAAAAAIGPWEAAVGMAASSFIVVLNALRVDAAGQDWKPWKPSTSSSLSPSRSYS